MLELGAKVIFENYLDNNRPLKTTVLGRRVFEDSSIDYLIEHPKGWHLTREDLKEPGLESLEGIHAPRDISNSTVRAWYVSEKMLTEIK